MGVGVEMAPEIRVRELGVKAGTKAFGSIKELGVAAPPFSLSFPPLPMANLYQRPALLAPFVDSQTA